VIIAVKDLDVFVELPNSPSGGGTSLLSDLDVVRKLYFTQAMNDHIGETCHDGGHKEPESRHNSDELRIDGSMAVYFPGLLEYPWNQSHGPGGKGNGMGSYVEQQQYVVLWVVAGREPV